MRSPRPVEQPPPLTGARPVRNATRADQVYEQVFAWIAEGHLARGAALPSEPQLCQTFQVSRPVVREALARLRADALIISRQGARSIVGASPVPEVVQLAPVGTIADLLRVMEFRLAVEPEAAALAAARRTARELAAIRRAGAACEAAAEAGHSDSHADWAFHLAVTSACGNQVFVAVLQRLSEGVLSGMNVARALSARLPRARVSQMRAEHGAIIDALAAGEPGAARTHMARHLTAARARIVGDTGRSPIAGRLME